MSRQIGHLHRKRNIAKRQRRHLVARINKTHSLAKYLRVALELPGGVAKGQLHLYIERELMREL